MGAGWGEGGKGWGQWQCQRHPPNGVEAAKQGCSEPVTRLTLKQRWNVVLDASLKHSMVSLCKPPTSRPGQSDRLQRWRGPWVRPPLPAGRQLHVAAAASCATAASQACLQVCCCRAAGSGHGVPQQPRSLGRQRRQRWAAAPGTQRLKPAASSRSSLYLQICWLRRASGSVADWRSVRVHDRDCCWLACSRPGFARDLLNKRRGQCVGLRRARQADP